MGRQPSSTAGSGATVSFGPAGRELAALLAPISPESFIADYWGSRSLYISGAADKFTELFDQTALRAALPNRTGMIKAGGQGTRATPITPDQFDPLFESGLTLCTLQLEQADSTLRRLCLAAGSQLGLVKPSLFNCYYSSDGHGFPLHCDDHSVFILQIAGAKRWFYGERPVAPSLTGSLFGTTDYIEAFNSSNPGSDISVT